MIRALMIAAAVLFGATAAQAASGDKLDRGVLGVQTFAAEFSEPLSVWSPENPGGVWKTDYYFGNQRGAYARATTPAENFTARSLPGELQVYTDEDYCPGTGPFKVMNGALYIHATRLSVANVARCGQSSRAYGSGLVTTEKSFLQALGYFEARVYVPEASGTWPAFWLLPDPADKTAANAGRLPEIDVFEFYAGDVPGIVVNARTGQLLNRTGILNTTVHTGTSADPKVASYKAAAPIGRLAFHTYGVLWTASELVFYLDGVEYWRTPFSYRRPMYLLLNLAVSDKVAGDPAKGAYPTYMAVDYVRAWALK